MTPGDSRWFSIASDLHETNCPKLGKNDLNSPSNLKLINNHSTSLSRIFPKIQFLIFAFPKISKFGRSAGIRSGIKEAENKWTGSPVILIELDQMRLNSCPTASMSMISRSVLWPTLISQIENINLWDSQLCTSKIITVRLKYDDTHSDQKFSESKLYPLSAWAFQRTEKAYPRNEEALRRRFQGVTRAFHPMRGQLSGLQ